MEIHLALAVGQSLSLMKDKLQETVTNNALNLPLSVLDADIGTEIDNNYEPLIATSFEQNGPTADDTPVAESKSEPEASSSLGNLLPLLPIGFIKYFITISTNYLIIK
jgi:hypothetical protein